ncbi:MAG: hypothetical protein QOE97_108, partial [Pseudonocardiales bacterium]|nr:hypothetical protein [Pseudonocardiales bacterium]
RLAVVLQVLYLMFNEGYTASGGDVPIRGELTAEAIRLARVLHAALPGQAEVAGLLALLLLTEARRPARTDDDGWLVPLDRQDRSRWDAGMVAEGIDLLGRTLGTAPAGPYQLQAAIAAVHDEAAAAGQTDWPQILALYDVLEAVAPSPVVTLNRAVAVAMVHGPLAGLAVLGTLAADERLTHSHRLVAVRAYLQELAGRRDEARQDYLAASRGTLNTAERRYLRIKAAELSA